MTRQSVMPGQTSSPLSSGLLQRKCNACNQEQESSLLHRSVNRELQPKLTVGAADDLYEQEADRVATQVMSMTMPTNSYTVQRETASEDEQEKVQTKPLVKAISPVIQQAKMLKEDEGEKPLQTKRSILQVTENRLTSTNEMPTLLARSSLSQASKLLIQRQEDESLRLNKEKEFEQKGKEYLDKLRGKNPSVGSSSSSSGGHTGAGGVSNYSPWFSQLQALLVEGRTWGKDEEEAQNLLSDYAKWKVKTSDNGRLHPSIEYLFRYIGRSEANDAENQKFGTPHAGDLGGSPTGTNWCAQASSTPLINLLKEKNLRFKGGFEYWLNKGEGKSKLIGGTKAHTEKLNPGDVISLVGASTPVSGHVATIIEAQGDKILMVSGNAGGGGGSVRLEEVKRGQPPKGYDWNKAVGENQPKQPGVNVPSAPGEIWIVVIEQMSQIDPSQIDPTNDEQLAKLGLELIKPSPKKVQPKLTLEQAGDQYEQEADRVATQVMSMTVPINLAIQREMSSEEEDELQTKPLATSITPLIQREMMPEEEEEQLQAKREGQSFAVDSNLESQLENTRGKGTPLPIEVREFMEPRFGVDFSQVRVHTDSESMQMNRSLGAQAFTYRNDIYFAADKYDARSQSGKELLAHELTHVIQQTGTVQRSPDDSPKIPPENWKTKFENAVSSKEWAQAATALDNFSMREILEALENVKSKTPKALEEIGKQSQSSKVAIGIKTVQKALVSKDLKDISSEDIEVIKDYIYSKIPSRHLSNFSTPAAIYFLTKLGNLNPATTRVPMMNGSLDPKHPDTPDGTLEEATFTQEFQKVLFSALFDWKNTRSDENLCNYNLDPKQSKILEDLKNQLQIDQQGGKKAWSDIDQEEEKKVREDEGRLREKAKKAGTEDAQRDAIVELAMSQVGQVDSADRGDGKKYGWKRIERYYEGVKLGKDPTRATEAAALYPHDPAGIKKGPWSWCGIFDLWAISAIVGEGKDIKWDTQSVGGPVLNSGDPKQQYTKGKRPALKKGTLLHIASHNQHKVLLAEDIPADADDNYTYKAVEANSYNQSIIYTNFRKVKNITHYVDIVGEIGKQKSTSSNQAPQSSSSDKTIQPKLFNTPLSVIGKPANRIAKQVLTMPAPTDQQRIQHSKGLAEMIQLQSSPPDPAEIERVRKLNQDYENALQEKDWKSAAEFLNAFNQEDILSKLQLLQSWQIGSIHQGAIDNPKVGPGAQVAQLTRVEHLNLNYKNAVKSDNWQAAALYLNAFRREDIITRLKELSREQINKLHEGAISNEALGSNAQIVKITQPEAIEILFKETERQEAPKVEETKKQPQQQASKIKSGASLAVITKIKEQYDEYIQEASNKYGISVEKIRAIIALESRGNPKASSGAAFGLMQVTKDTWQGTCRTQPELKDYDFDTYWQDPRINILVGTAVFKGKMGTLGIQADSPNFAKLAVVAYNAGERTVKNAIALAKEKGSDNPETDCLQSEYLKPAIESTRIYTYYLTGEGYKRNHHLKAKGEPKDTSTLEEAKEAAVELKYQEITRYPDTVSDYINLQSQVK